MIHLIKERGLSNGTTRRLRDHSQLSSLLDIRHEVSYQHACLQEHNGRCLTGRDDRAAQAAVLLGTSTLNHTRSIKKPVLMTSTTEAFVNETPVFGKDTLAQDCVARSKPKRLTTF